MSSEHLSLETAVADRLSGQTSQAGVGLAVRSRVANQGHGGGVTAGGTHLLVAPRPSEPGGAVRKSSIVFVPVAVFAFLLLSPQSVLALGRRPVSVTLKAGGGASTAAEA